MHLALEFLAIWTKKWKPWVSGSKCRQDLLVNKFSYMTKFWADMSYLGGRLVPLVTLVF